MSERRTNPRWFCIGDTLFLEPEFQLRMYQALRHYTCSAVTMMEFFDDGEVFPENTEKLAELLRTTPRTVRKHIKIVKEFLDDDWQSIIDGRNPLPPVYDREACIAEMARERWQRQYRAERIARRVTNADTNTA